MGDKTPRSNLLYIIIVHENLDLPLHTYMIHVALERWAQEQSLPYGVNGAEGVRINEI